MAEKHAILKNRASRDLEVYKIACNEATRYLWEIGSDGCCLKKATINGHWWRQETFKEIWINQMWWAYILHIEQRNAAQMTSSRFSPQKRAIVIFHMGWNRLRICIPFGWPSNASRCWHLFVLQKAGGLGARWVSKITRSSTAKDLPW